MSAKTKEKLVLFIDTSNNKKTIVKLGDKEIIKEYDNPREQKLLELIDKLLTDTKTKKESISEILVNLGPGSYTGLRVGCSVANTLAWALGIKVNGKDRVEPVYN